MPTCSNCCCFSLKFFFIQQQPDNLLRFFHLAKLKNSALKQSTCQYNMYSQQQTKPLPPLTPQPAAQPHPRSLHHSPRSECPWYRTLNVHHEDFWHSSSGKALPSHRLHQCQPLHNSVQSKRQQQGLCLYQKLVMRKFACTCQAHLSLQLRQESSPPCESGWISTCWKAAAASGRGTRSQYLQEA